MISNKDMTSSIGATKVADLTIDEFRELVQEVVIQTLSEMMSDPDEGLELRDDFVEEMKQFLADVKAGGKTVPAQKVAERLGLIWRCMVWNLRPMPNPIFVSNVKIRGYENSLVAPCCVWLQMDTGLASSP